MVEKAPGKISVGCKLPSGLTVTHEGTTVTFKGSNDPRAIMGFGVTKVDADWFKGWAEAAGKKFKPLASGAIFAYEGSDMRGAIRDHKDVVTGFEPLNPDKPMAGVEPTDEQKKELAKARAKREQDADEAGEE